MSVLAAIICFGFVLVPGLAIQIWVSRLVERLDESCRDQVKRFVRSRLVKLFIFMWAVTLGGVPLLYLENATFALVWGSLLILSMIFSVGLFIHWERQLYLMVRGPHELSRLEVLFRTQPTPRVHNPGIPLEGLRSREIIVPQLRPAPVEPVVDGAVQLTPSDDDMSDARPVTDRRPDQVVLPSFGE